MKHFKKRTIALVLASVVTVVGAFGAENFKNSLMSLKFENDSTGAVSMTLHTKRDYTKTITPIKKDATTYVIMLPETNSQMSAQPELSGNVESVNVRTMPYTTSSSGYTKITIKTLPNTSLSTKKALYIPEQAKPVETPNPEQEPAPIQQNPAGDAPRIAQTEILQNTNPENNNSRYRNETIHSRSGVDQTNPVDIKQSVHQFEPPRPAKATPPSEPDKTSKIAAEKAAQPLPDYENAGNGTEILLLIMGIVLVSITCVYLFIRTKNKMAEILGEQPEFELDDVTNKTKEDNKQKDEKKKKIKTTIKKLDKMYTKPVKMPLEHLTEQAAKTTEPEQANTEENVIVDLDELFQEKVKQDNQESTIYVNEEEENLALEDFLSAFSFTDEEPEPENLYNEELFNKFLNDKNLKFSKSDIEKINALLNSEISDETIKNIEQYTVTNPIEKRPSHKELLENFVTAYTINQNITFTKEDIAALNKLMSVEIDNDFLTDLRTNPHRMEEMQKEIERNKAKPHKTSELLTLNVKDMLPDLSEALKKQGGRKIESEVKPQVVYYSEGYDVSTISLKDQLPDLSKEINNAEAYKSRPSDEIQLAESGYDVAKMSVSDELLDIEDMLKNPEKYETPAPTHVIADEETLLKNISNVTFKPFYDGSENFEVVNEFDEANAPTVSDMQEEFSQFDEGFEIIRDEEEIPQEQEREINDFESLYDNTYVDFDKGFAQNSNSFMNTQGTAKGESSVIPDTAQIQEEMPVSNKPQPSVKPKRTEEADKLLEFIETKRKKQKLQSAQIEERSKETANTAIEDDKTIEAAPAPVCIVDGEKYDILDTAEISHKTGCYLAQKTSEYFVIGYTNTKAFILKQYDDIKMNKIQVRLSEKLENGMSRYIVKAGTHKFILNAGLNTLEYVMDLC